MCEAFTGTMPIACTCEEVIPPASLLADAGDPPGAGDHGAVRRSRSRACARRCRRPTMRSSSTPMAAGRVLVMQSGRRRRLRGAVHRRSGPRLGRSARGAAPRHGPARRTPAPRARGERRRPAAARRRSRRCGGRGAGCASHERRPHPAGFAIASPPGYRAGPRQLGEARAPERALARRGDPRRWRRAGLLWPLFAKD